MKKLAVLLSLLVAVPLYAEEILRIEGSAFGEYFDLAHAPGSEMVVTDEGLQGTSGGTLYSSIIDVVAPSEFVRVEWNLSGAEGSEVSVLTAAESTEEMPALGQCLRFFRRNGLEVDEATYQSSPRALLGETVTYTCFNQPLDQIDVATSGEGGGLSPDQVYMQLRVRLSATEPFVLRSLVLYDDAGPTAVEATSWGAVKGRE